MRDRESAPSRRGGERSDQGRDPAEEDTRSARHVRVAWQYYIEGYTQEQIARRLGVTRARVNRMLAACRERGLVQIRVNSRLAPCVELEERLRATFGVEARVTLSPEDPARVYDVISVEAANYLGDILPATRSLGVGWGKTLRFCQRALSAESAEVSRVVTLQGGITRGSGANTFEIAARFADKLGAEPQFLAAPLYAASAEARTTLWSQASLYDVYAAAASTDVAMVSVGDLSPASTLVYLGLITDHLAELEQAGAVGDILGHFLDRHGRLVEHGLNNRVMALSLDNLTRLNEVIMVSGGPHKADIMRAVLRRGCVTTVITDHDTAAAMLADTQGLAAAAQ